MYVKTKNFKKKPNSGGKPPKFKNKIITTNLIKE